MNNKVQFYQSNVILLLLNKLGWITKYKNSTAYNYIKGSIMGVKQLISQF